MAITESELIERLKAKIDRQESALRHIKSVLNGEMAPGAIDTLKTLCAIGLEEKG